MLELELETRVKHQVIELFSFHLNKGLSAADRLAFLSK